MFTYIVYSILLILLFKILSHFLKEKLKLDSQSVVLITGGCMGLGRKTALCFASKHKCNIIILDIREDLSS